MLRCMFHCQIKIDMRSPLIVRQIFQENTLMIHKLKLIKILSDVSLVVYELFKFNDFQLRKTLLYRLPAKHASLGHRNK